MDTFEGWIFDVERAPHGVHLWVREEGGGTRRLSYSISPSFFVYGEDIDYGRAISFVRRCKGRASYREAIDFFSGRAVRALSVAGINPRFFPRLLRSLAREMGEENLYSCDIPLEQLFFYETGSFPFGRCLFKADGRGYVSLLEPLEEAWEISPGLPPLSVMQLKALSPAGRDPLKSPWSSLEVTCEGSSFELEWERGAGLIEGLNGLIRRYDPDVVISEWGDEYLLPSLHSLAREAGIPLSFSRDGAAGGRTASRGRGRSFFSYGKIIYRAPSSYFQGRLHLDAANSFFYGEVGLGGIAELARISKIPLQRLSRASPGTVISAMEVELAWQEDMLIPYKKRQTEKFKGADELVRTDKGGLVYMPPVGAFEGVCELDFASMYPALMVKYNISPETLLCSCCRGRSVPETGTWTCLNRRGLIPRVLEPVIERRKIYREMASVSKGSEREVYNARQTALKWILVVCFGFLGYRNARFGKIEAHEAVTAWGREKLLAAKEIAEREGYAFLHGLTDALWVRREGALEEDYRRLAEMISTETEMDIAVEGIYRWIAFLPSKMRKGLPVPGRFLGVFKSGEVKTRGIGERRRDTPLFIKRMQREMLEVASSFTTLRGLRENRGLLEDIRFSYLEGLLSGRVTPEELAICRRLSRPVETYSRNTMAAQVVRELLGRGVTLRPGEKIRYVITGSKKSGEGEKARSLGFFSPDYSPDTAKYADMLEEAARELMQIVDEGF